MRLQVFFHAVGFFLLATGCVNSNRNEAAASAAVRPEADTNGFRCNTQPHSSLDLAGIAYGPSCTELTTAYPAIVDPAVPEDPRVICPLLRIVNRSKALAANIATNLQGDGAHTLRLPATIDAIIGMTTTFGCGTAACLDVAKGVSAGMFGKPKSAVTGSDLIDLGNLSTAKGIAHDCGFNFSYGDTAVNPATRDATLAQFAARAVDGKISFATLMQLKKDMCKRDFLLSQNGTLPTKNALTPARDSLQPGSADATEVNLIFTYLGGVDNGYILYSDVDRFFHADFPANKTKYLVDFPLFAQLQQSLR